MWNKKLWFQLASVQPVTVIPSEISLYESLDYFFFFLSLLEIPCWSILKAKTESTFFTAAQFFWLRASIINNSRTRVILVSCSSLCFKVRAGVSVNFMLSSRLCNYDTTHLTSITSVLKDISRLLYDMQINICIDDAPQLQVTRKRNTNLSTKITKNPNK